MNHEIEGSVKYEIKRKAFTIFKIFPKLINTLKQVCFKACAGQ